MRQIYFLCPDLPQPVGGVKILYRHVDVLNAHGYHAAIVHRKKRFRCTWFENETRVTYQHKIQPGPADFIMIPEVYGPRCAELFPGVPKFIFNQNAYYTFVHYLFDLRDRATPYLHPDVKGALVVSEDSRRYLQFAFPQLTVDRVHNWVNADLFAYREPSAKRPQICFMVRKHPEDALQVINILKFRGALDGIDVVPIDNRTELDVAAILADALLFLSFGYPEGCPLPPMEAMLSGCLTVGYHGMGARETMRPEFTWPVEINDIPGYAKTVEDVLRLWRSAPDALAQQTRAAHDFIAREYSRARETADILALWERLTATGKAERLKAESGY